MRRGDTPRSDTTATDWRAVADELADALRQAMLRNPTVTAQAWARANAVLGRYEDAKGAELLAQ